MRTRSDFRICSYLDSDLAAVRALLDGLQEAECRMEANRAHWADGGAAYAAGVLDEVARHSGAVFVAEAPGGDVMGLVACWRASDDTDITVVPEARPHLYVSEIFVVETWRGRGIGSALLAAAERHGRDLGLKQITIGVLAVNRAARGTYAKAGFEEYEILLRKQL